MRDGRRELADEGNVPPVRVGIHTGPALASEGDWYGRTVNVAARLCAEAKNGQILVGQRVAAAVESAASLEEIGNLPLKGLSQPIVVYNVME